MSMRLVRASTWLCALLLLVSLAGCSSDPARGDEAYRAAFEKYMELLSEKKVSALYALLTPESQSSITEESFTRRHNSIYGDIDARNITVEISGLSALEIPRDSLRAGGRRIAYHMSMDTLAGTIEFDNTADIYAYKEGEETTFLLNWDAHIIFPELTADRPVRIQSQKAKRGSVYDKNGVLLAGEGVVKSVGLVPGKMAEDREADIGRIAAILMITAEEIKEKLSAAWVTDELFVPLYELPEADVERKEKLLEIPGIRIDDKKGRVYPYGEEVAQEAQYRDKLRGSDGYRISITDARGEILEVLAEKPVVDGEDVQLDIDVMA